MAGGARLMANVKATKHSFPGGYHTTAANEAHLTLLNVVVSIKSAAIALLFGLLWCGYELIPIWELRRGGTPKLASAMGGGPPPTEFFSKKAF